MQPIGGYFSLELPIHKEYHQQALRLNTGRNGLEYILRTRKYRKVYIPYYTCEVILEPFAKLDVQYEFYHINLDFELSNFLSLNEGEALLYTNYYGLKQNYIERLAANYGKQLIVDNTQAFYSKPIEGIDTFYTCRKFFGVPDGAYLYIEKPLELVIEQDVSYDRMFFLTKRIDISAEAAYADFREESLRLANNPIRWMSALTMRMMASIDYEYVAEQRRKNFTCLHSSLASSNILHLKLDENAVPMIYPYFVDDGAELRKQLIKKKIFIARYWENVLEWAEKSSIDFQLALNVLPIPIDQRYGIQEMAFIIDNILFSK